MLADWRIRLDAALGEYKLSGNDRPLRRVLDAAASNVENNRKLWEMFMRRNGELVATNKALVEQAGVFRPLTEEPDDEGLYIVINDDGSYAEVWWWVGEDWTENVWGDGERIPAHWDSDQWGSENWKEVDGSDSWACYYRRVALPRYDCDEEVE